MKFLPKVQAASGAVFAFFLVLHLATTASAATGIAGFDNTLITLRSVYRPNIAVELILIGVPLAVHAVCALVQMGRRFKTRPNPKPHWHIRVHRWTGYYLLVVIIGHVFATRIMPLFGAGPTATGSADFSYLAYSLVHWPAFFYPYYILLGFCGAVHMCLGVGIAARVLTPKLAAKLPVQKISTALAAVCGVIAVIGVLFILSNAWHADRSRFAEYDAVYDKFMPFMKPLNH
ncbi:MAG: hypothetical protein IT462_11010 [Planctomycetes bacterium]|nr:hypothetical protein [Planctomycetota bacterium]